MVENEISSCTRDDIRQQSISQWKKCVGIVSTLYAMFTAHVAAFSSK